MKKYVMAMLGAIGLIGASVPAQAGLMGDAVFGTLCFNVGATCQFWNPQNATVGAGVEYSYQDAANIDQADFSDTQLVITDKVLEGANGWVMTFKIADLLGATVTEASDNFTNGGVAFSLTGDTLTLTWNGTPRNDGLLTAVYDIRTVPEPASLALMGLGLAGLVAARRRVAK